MVTIGNCNDHSYTPWWDKTWIIPVYQFPTNGIITSFCFYSAGSGTVQLKIYRDIGTQFQLVGQSSLYTIVAGSNPNLSANITVQAGDYVGFYSSSVCKNDYEGGEPALLYVAGNNQTEYTDKSIWGSDGNKKRLSILVTYVIAYSTPTCNLVVA